MNYQKKIEIGLAKTDTSFTSTGIINLKRIISYFIISLFLTVSAELLPKIVLAVGEEDVATSSNHETKNVLGQIGELAKEFLNSKGQCEHDKIINMVTGPSRVLEVELFDRDELVRTLGDFLKGNITNSDGEKLFLALSKVDRENVKLFDLSDFRSVDRVKEVLLENFGSRELDYHPDYLKLSAFSDINNLGIMNIERLINLDLNDKNGKSDYGVNVITSFDSTVLPSANLSEVRSNRKVFSVSFDGKLNDITKLGIRLNSNYSNHLNVETENATNYFYNNSIIGSIYSSIKITDNILLISDVKVGQVIPVTDTYLEKGKLWGTALTASYDYHIKNISLVPKFTVSYGNLFLKAKAAENQITENQIIIMPGLSLNTSIDFGNFKLKPELMISNSNEIGESINLCKVSTNINIGISSKQFELNLGYGKSFSNTANVSGNNFAGMFKINF